MPADVLIDSKRNTVSNDKQRAGFPARFFMGFWVGQLPFGTIEEEISLIFKKSNQNCKIGEGTSSILPG
jgi:hypothetical protein